MSAQQRRPTYAPERFDPRRDPPRDPPERYLGAGRRDEEYLDIREILKREALNPLPPPAHAGRPQPRGVSDQYVVLDTFLKLRESATDRGEFRWNFMVQGVTGDEVIGVRDEIDNVIEIQIGAFAMPNPPEVPYVVENTATLETTGQYMLRGNNIGTTSTSKPPPKLGINQYPEALLVPGPGTTWNNTPLSPWVHNPYSQVPFFGGLTVQVCEAGLQSYSDRKGARHHFEFRLTAPNDGANPNMLLARPMRGTQWDTYTFTDPLKDIHGITLIFRNPDAPIHFLPDCLYGVTAKYNDPPFTFKALRFYAPGHQLRMGDRIFVSGFKSGDAGLDAYVNRPEGLVASGNFDSPIKLEPGVAIAEASLEDYFWTDPGICLQDVKFPWLVPDAPAVPAVPAGPGGVPAAVPAVPAVPAHTEMRDELPPQSVTVCVANRRMRIPMRIRRVVDRVPNHITP